MLSGMVEMWRSLTIGYDRKKLNNLIDIHQCELLEHAYIC